MMTDENTHNNDQEEHDILDEAVEAAFEETPEAALALEVERLQAENDELRDRSLRISAEMENLRKRTEREVADGKNYAISNFARDMLVATDNMARALVVIPQEARDAAEGTLKSLIEGIEMTEREMQRLMQKNGVKQIDALNAKFDPHLHQAMFEIPDESVVEGTVLQVLQAGYVIGDRILRPAMVGVSKGGPKKAAEETPNA